MRHHPLFKSLLIILMCSLASVTWAKESASYGTPLSIKDARHLLSRTGFGASPTEINHLIGKNRAEAVGFVINGLTTKTLTTPPTWITNSAPQHYRLGDLSAPDKQKFRMARQNEVQSLRQWWIQEMINSPNPQTERLLLFWHNHFATAYSSLNHQAISVARQHMMLREHASGNFRDLLKNIIRDPAMLNYLDNNSSKKQKPNENLARELLELFTLGEGSYSEADIKNAARALTGYSYSEFYDMRYTFKPWIHDTGVKTIFGEEGKFNGDDLIDLILKQPDTARFITAKLWRELVGDVKKNDETITTHANAFRDSDYDIKTLYKSVLLSDHFWNPKNRATIVKSPTSLTVGAIRSTGILPPDWQTLPVRLQQMGQHLFEPPNVAGWPGGTAWITPGKLLTRLDWLEQLGSISPETPQSGNMNAMMSAGAQTESMSMQSSSPMTMDPMPMASSNTNNRAPLTIRMASEEFDEQVKYRVRVLGRNKAAWDSGVLELHGGHDTKRMGRAERTNLPWQTINFPVHIPAEKIIAIEISFINDGATPDGADRNLFVSRAVMEDRVWLPSNGKQTGKCARKQPAQQGNLYCPGTLRMEESSVINTPTHTPKTQDTLKTSSVFFHFSQPAKRKPHSEMTFVLSDVEFDNRFWKTLKVRYLNHKNGQSLRLSSTDCWPECVIKWPECAWKNEQSVHTISLELEEDAAQCMYNELQESDKKLVKTLWSILDELYEIGSQSPKQQRENVARNYTQWRATVDTMLNKISASHFYDASTKLEVITKPITDPTLGEHVVKPVPAGHTTEQRRETLRKLQLQETDLDLTALLLPIDPANRTSATNATLQEIITDLSFQLQ